MLIVGRVPEELLDVNMNVKCLVLSLFIAKILSNLETGLFRKHLLGPYVSDF